MKIQRCNGKSIEILLHVSMKHYRNERRKEKKTLL